MWRSVAFPLVTLRLANRINAIFKFDVTDASLLVTLFVVFGSQRVADLL